jgi:hypothetical protein
VSQPELNLFQFTTCLMAKTSTGKHTPSIGAEPRSSPLSKLPLSVEPECGGGLLLLRHVTPLPRRDVVYFYSGVHTSLSDSLSIGARPTFRSLPRNPSHPIGGCLRPGDLFLLLRPLDFALPRHARIEMFIISGFDPG